MDTPRLAVAVILLTSLSVEALPKGDLAMVDIETVETPAEIKHQLPAQPSASSAHQAVFDRNELGRLITAVEQTSDSAQNLATAKTQRHASRLKSDFDIDDGDLRDAVADFAPAAHSQSRAVPHGAVRAHQPARHGIPPQKRLPQINRQERRAALTVAQVCYQNLAFSVGFLIKTAKKLIAGS